MNLAIDEYKSNTFTNNNGLENNGAVQCIYAFTNENLRQYIDLLNIAYGRVATVGSSGDQVFYSVFKDAEEVTLIDGNPYAKPMVELKKSAIENMTYDEFMRYWSKENILNPKTTKELLGDISAESRKFFEYILEQMSGANYYEISDRIVNHNSFAPIYYTIRDMQFSAGCEFYDNKRSYNILKKKLYDAKITYELSEFNRFTEHLKGKYNSIILSNVWDYVDSGSYCMVTDRLIHNNLARWGTMQMHYEMGGTPDFLEYYWMNQYKPKIKYYLVQDQIRFDEDRNNSRGLKRFFGKKSDYPKNQINEPEVVDRGQELVYIFEK